MKGLLIILVIALGLTFLGWIRFSSSETTSAVTLDKQKVQQDAEKVVEKSKEALEDVKETFDKSSTETDDSSEEIEEETELSPEDPDDDESLSLETLKIESR